jgi:hypothetical protein
LFNSLEASSLAIAGGARSANKDGSSDVLSNPSTPFQVFHAVFGRRNVLQVRGYTSQTQQTFEGRIGSNALFVKAEIPRSLSLNDLQDQVGDFRVVWHPQRLSNAQRRHSRAGFAELWLSRESRMGLKAQLSSARQPPYEPLIPAGSLIGEWVLAQKQVMAKAGSNRYKPPSNEEIRFFDEDILTPLLLVAKTQYQMDGLTPQGKREIDAINWSGALLGYRVHFHSDTASGQDFLVLAESSANATRRHWGSFVIRLGATSPYIVEVPRPLHDLNSLEYGLHLFEGLRAESLLLAGAHSEANQDQTSDPLDFRNRSNLLSLINQVVMRQSHGIPLMAIQCRGFSRASGAASGSEILLAFPDGISKKSLLTPLGRGLHDQLLSEGRPLQFVDGSPETAGYEISSMPQAQYVTESAHQEFAIVWLSQTLRDAFRSQDREYPLQVQLQALGIPIVHEDVANWLKTRLGSSHRTQLPPELRRLLDGYVATLDIVTLQKALEEWPTFELKAVLDRNSGQLFLVISKDPTALPVLLNLRSADRAFQPAHMDDRTRLEWFLASRNRWLEWSL